MRTRPLHTTNHQRSEPVLLCSHGRSGAVVTPARQAHVLFVRGGNGSVVGERVGETLLEWRSCSMTLQKQDETGNYLLGILASGLVRYTLLPQDECTTYDEPCSSS